MVMMVPSRSKRQTSVSTVYEGMIWRCDGAGKCCLYVLAVLEFEIRQERTLRESVTKDTVHVYACCAPFILCHDHNN